MARIELIMPKMGESVSEATIISWSKKVGDLVEIDETIIEIATDKVDSEVPSTHEGKLVEMLFNVDDIVNVGQAAILETTQEGDSDNHVEAEEVKEEIAVEEISQSLEQSVEKIVEEVNETKAVQSSNDRFYSPLVKNIAKKENVSQSELDSIIGSGKEGRVTKSDILSFIENRTKEPAEETTVEQIKDEKPKIKEENIKHDKHQQVPIHNTGDVEIIEMDRMRKLISSHMTMSKATSAHITSMVECDMTNIVNWRNSVKEDFKKEKSKHNIYSYNH